MIVNRYVNGVPITAEALSRLNVTNDTLERIIAAVRRRMEQARENHQV